MTGRREASKWRDRQRAGTRRGTRAVICTAGGPSPPRVEPLYLQAWCLHGAIRSSGKARLAFTGAQCVVQKAQCPASTRWQTAGEAVLEERDD